MIFLILGIISGFLLSTFVMRWAIDNGSEKVLSLYFPKSEGYSFGFKRKAGE